MKYLCLVYLDENRLGEVRDSECKACSDGLRDSGHQIAKDLRAIPDEKLDMARELPSGGTMTVQQRIERVLIGHITGHQGSIEATTA